MADARTVKRGRKPAAKPVRKTDAKRALIAAGIERIREEAEKAGVKVGRPTTYTPELCDAVVQHAATTGMSLTAFAASINQSREVLTDWGQTYPEFRLAMDRAKAARSAFLERQSLDTENAAVINFRLTALKNCGPTDWRDSTDVRIGGLPDAPPVKLDVNLTPQQAYDAILRGGTLPDA